MFSAQQCWRTCELLSDSTAGERVRKGSSLSALLQLDIVESSAVAGQHE